MTRIWTLDIVDVDVNVESKMRRKAVRQGDSCWLTSLVIRGLQDAMTPGVHMSSDGGGSDANDAAGWSKLWS
ncbi:hypothetical protein ACLKA7_016902 [Drosophila subpalustris]